MSIFVTAILFPSEIGIENHFLYESVLCHKKIYNTKQKMRLTGLPGYAENNWGRG
jgi:hypothetical protein